MALTINRNMTRWIIIVASFLIISLILWNTYVFFQYFKSEERAKMKIWTNAYIEFSNDLNDIQSGSDDVEINLVAENIVVDSTLTTPLLLIDKNGTILSSRNISPFSNSTEPEDIKKDSAYVAQNYKKLIAKFSEENEPVVLENLNRTLYYGNTPLLNKLKYYPLALLLIIFLFAAVAFFFYRSTKTADQNRLWTGMAKETAHQIGTPLSSLVGWTEILRSENVNPDYLVEIEKDVTRLQTITERFSKIGSMPTLEKTDIVKETLDSYEYLKARSSKLIDFEISTPSSPLYVSLNQQLYSWTIENLVKNAIDAMKGKGNLKLAITNDDKHVKVTVQDSGKGISKQSYNAVFQPGYTTKKRGWGLGLSLAKRIIEDYHNGKIKVLHSEIGKGTTMQISLKLLS
ncbi:PAS domain-containing sensor histidine kinase [Psychroserpens sp. SPM9]|uniref:sensor histidine kinase n=1 Tax=Psychroserpens sp. SPM9 TaxID=2975598 RepID=UPI0021A76E61|nr:HAMP domain-containing sensor histidine kinase [Psychroserpens sp. SPM9]MDG5490410.1 HAMP domain-containing sensor histidine kinase [Psychroserpens sp. SPM9]